MNRIEHVEAQLAGDEGVEVYAVRAGISADELREWKALYLAGGKAAFAPPLRRKKLWVAAAVALAAALPATVYAVTCAPGLPGGLITFCTDTPAYATDVNQNFLVLANNLIGRTGAWAADGGVTPNITQPSGATFGAADGTVNFNHPVVINGGATLTGATINGGATVTGAANLNGGGNLSGNFSGNPSFTGAPTFNGTPSFNGGMTITGTTTIYGDLRASSIRHGSCTWRGGTWVQRDADTGSGCNYGEFAAGFSCRVPTGWYLACSTYCCTPQP